jgi:hypothetical protein
MLCCCNNQIYAGMDQNEARTHFPDRASRDGPALSAPKRQFIDYGKFPDLLLESALPPQGVNP